MGKAAQGKALAAGVKKWKSEGWEIVPLPSLNQADGALCWCCLGPLDSLSKLGEAIGKSIAFKPVAFDDVKCCDCEGRVEYFLMPDLAWNGLGFKAEDYACLDCVCKRMNLDPNLPIQDLAEAISKKFRSPEFGLSVMTLINGEPGRHYRTGVDKQAKTGKMMTVSIIEDEES